MTLLLPLLLMTAPLADTAAVVDTATLFSTAEQAAIKQLGATITPEGNVRLGNVTLDPKRKEISFEGYFKIVANDILEVLIATPAGRAHEALVVADIDPLHLQVLLYLAGYENGARKPGDKQGALFRIEAQPEGGGRRPIEEYIRHISRKGHEPIRDWVFVGSSFDGGDCLATREGNVALLWSYGQSIFDNPMPDGDDDNAFFPYQPNLPPDVEDRQVPVKIFFTPKEKTLLRQPVKESAKP